MGAFQPDLEPGNTGEDQNPQQAGEDQAKEDTVTISSKEWDEVKTTLEHYKTSLATPQNAWQQQAPPPPTPAGPTYQEQLGDLEDQISGIDDKIDERIADGKPVKALLNKRSALERKINRLEMEQTIAPIQEMGTQAISHLTQKVTRADMPHYDLVKKDMDNFLAGLTPEQRMNPQVMEMVYQQAVGANHDKILQAEMEKANRVAAEQKMVDAKAPARAEKQKYGDVEVPPMEEVMSPEALQVLQNSGRTPDDFFAMQGCPGGWPEYYAKHKDFM